MAANRRFTAHVGSKFNTDGRVRRFPGNTIISDIPPESGIYSYLNEIQDGFRALPGANKWAFLPPESFHMTVMELLCDQVREPERWSCCLSLDTSLEETDRFFQEKLAQVAPPQNFRMRVAGIYAQEVIVVVLQPAIPDSAEALIDYRERIAQATSVRFPDHDRYVFHVTLAYKLAELDLEEASEVEAAARFLGAALVSRIESFCLGAPRLAFFENMFEFKSRRSNG